MAQNKFHTAELKVKLQTTVKGFQDRKGEKIRVGTFLNKLFPW